MKNVHEVEIKLEKEWVDSLDAVFKKKNKAAIEVFNTCHLENTGELNRIFERFYRLEESHSAATGGTGIGLSMAQAIVEAHGGKIEAVSPDGESLKIVVVL